MYNPTNPNSPKDGFNTDFVHDEQKTDSLGHMLAREAGCRIQTLRSWQPKVFMESVTLRLWRTCVRFVKLKGKGKTPIIKKQSDLLKHSWVNLDT